MDMEQIKLTTHAAAKAAGIGEVAKKLGWDGQKLRNKLNPQSEHHELWLSEFVAVLHHVDPTETLEAICAMFGGRFTTRNHRAMSSVMAAVLHGMNEHADIGKAVEAALTDDETPGEITPHERMQILRECAEARQAITMIENTLADPANVVHIEAPQGV